MIDVEQTAQAVEQAASQLKYASDEMYRIAVRMREHKDLTYAAEAINCVSNAFANCRLDLLITRPIRELTKDKE